MKKIKECPFCHNKPNVYPFISKIQENKEIPVLWTVECSELCDEWINKYSDSEEIIATETKEEAIEEWNKWVGDIENDNPCRH